MHIYDTHTHLNEGSLYQERETHLKEFIKRGGKGIVNSGASEDYNKNGISIAKIAEEKYPEIIVKATLAWHPLEVVEDIITTENYEEKMKEIKQQYKENKRYIVGIGETGIDLYYKNTPKILELQKKLFKMHCDWAKEENLPLIVHSRTAFKETMEILKTYTDLTIYFHCRGYGPEEMEEVQRSLPKLYVGFCGNITYKKTDALKESLKKVDKKQLVLETDAPYLSPQIVRGEKNHPANVSYIYEAAAEIRGIAKEDLAIQIEDNVKALYNI